MAASSSATVINDDRERYARAKVSGVSPRLMVCDSTTGSAGFSEEGATAAGFVSCALALELPDEQAARKSCDTMSVKENSIFCARKEQRVIKKKPYLYVDADTSTRRLWKTLGCITK